MTAKGQRRSRGRAEPQDGAVSHVEESRAGSDGRLAPAPSPRDPQTLLSGRQLPAETGRLMKAALALQPAVTLAVARLHRGTPDAPRGATGVAPRAPCCRGTRASLAAPGQSCSRWHADDNEISNISKVGFPETDLTRLSPTRTLGKVNLLFGAGESGGRLCPGRRAKTTAWGICRGAGSGQRYLKVFRSMPALGRCCGRLLPKPDRAEPPQGLAADPNWHPGVAPTTGHHLPVAAGSRAVGASGGLGRA